MQTTRIIAVLILVLTIAFAAAPSASAQSSRSCNRRSLLRIFQGNLFCGKKGFVTSTSINGDCPISACIITQKRLQTRSVFGPVF